MDIRVVGSGTMGNGIDQLLATSGSSVVLYDVNYEETGDSKFRVPPLLRNVNMSALDILEEREEKGLMIIQVELV